MNMYIFNPGVTTVDPPEGSTQQVAICEIPTSTGHARYAVPRHLLAFFKLFDGERETDEVIQIYNTSNNGNLTSDKARKLINDFCLPKSILLNPSQPSPVLVSSPANSYLYARRRLLSHKSIYPIAKLMRFLFSKSAIATVAALSLLAHLVFYIDFVPTHRVNINRITGYQFILITIITIVAAFFHELGHASALALSKCKRLEIGVGLYLYIPVLYTDVSEAWNLESRARARVDVGGVYFHAICQLILLSTFLAVGNEIYLYSFLFIDITMAYSMNPFLRMDGYWLIADLFGIFNLRKQSISFVSYYARRLWNPKGQHRRPGWQLSRTATVVLSTYTIVSLVFFGYLIIAMFRQVVFFLIPAYPGILSSLVSTLSGRPLSPVRVLGSFLEVGWRSLILVGCSLFICRTCYRVFERLRASVPWRRMLFLKKAAENSAS